LEAAKDNDADMVGLSGLITPSLDEMVTVAEEMERAELKIPLLIGGATTSRVHTALRIEQAYSGPVIHVLDASRAVGVASTLVSQTQRDPFVEKTASEYEDIRTKRGGKGGSRLVSIEDARANGRMVDFTAKPPPPERPGLHVYHEWPLDELRDYIDWTPFFRAWELAGTYPRILEDETVGESARELFEDAQAMLDRIVDEGWLKPRGVAGLWECRREGDDILVKCSREGGSPGPDSMGERSQASGGTGLLPSQEHGWIRLPMLRQQIAKRKGRANMCLADFIDPEGDWIGGFAVASGHGAAEHLERFKRDNDDYSDILFKALADRLAEAFAERMHEHVRQDLWGYGAEEDLSMENLIREKYDGIRPAPGYPACPDHTLKPLLFELLGGGSGHNGPAGIELTESMAMLPAAAVSGFYFGHPESSYFGVATIGE
ncbi:MAG: methionine synthase, partial [Sphingomonadales bacterium]|nr:methionine synthase [Sphingomonadales bacterium]